MKKTLEETIRGMAVADDAPTAAQARAKLLLVRISLGLTGLVVDQAAPALEEHVEAIRAFVERPSDEAALAAKAEADKMQALNIARTSNQHKVVFYGLLAVSAVSSKTAAGYVLGAAEAASRHVAGREKKADGLAEVDVEIRAAEREVEFAERSATRAAQKTEKKARVVG